MVYIYTWFSNVVGFHIHKDICDYTNPGVILTSNIGGAFQENSQDLDLGWWSSSTKKTRSNDFGNANILQLFIQISLFIKGIPILAFENSGVFLSSIEQNMSLSRGTFLPLVDAFKI